MRAVESCQTVAVLKPVDYEVTARADGELGPRMAMLLDQAEAVYQLAQTEVCATVLTLRGGNADETIKG